MKTGWVALLLLLGAVLAGCGERPESQAAQGTQPFGETQQAETGTPQASEETERQAVTSLVENFGKMLKMVSLLAPEQDVRNSLQTHYGKFVSPSLLEKWQNDPRQAPGRLVSSPWPDRIDVLAVEKVADDRYRVKGEIIEVASAGTGGAGGTGAGEAGGAEAKEKAIAEAGETAGAEVEAAVVIAAKRAITLEMGKFGDRWLIDAVGLGAYVDDPASSGDATPNTGDGQTHTGNKTAPGTEIRTTRPGAPTPQVAPPRPWFTKTTNTGSALLCRPAGRATRSSRILGKACPWRNRPKAR